MDHLLHHVVADDGNGRKFDGYTRHPNPEGEQKVVVLVHIDGENGWEAGKGVTALDLKKTGDGTFQS